MKLNPRRLSATLAALALTGALVAAPLPALAETIAVDESTQIPAETPADSAPETPAEVAPETPAEVAPETPAEDPTLTAPDDAPVETPVDPAPEAPSADEAPAEPAVDAPLEPQEAPVAPAAVVDGLGFTIDRAWIDPTVVNGSGRPFFSATMNFPPIDAGVHTVAHGTAPSGLATASHCQIARPADGVTGVTCEFLGTVTPGDSTVTIRVRSEGGHDYSASVPVTMCPLTGCSPLFEVTAVQAESIEVCPDEQLAGSFVYDFNVAWNASGAALGEEAPEGLTLDAGSVRDGGAFSIAGVVSEPGEYSIPIVVTDEFGVEHSTSVAVTITEPVPGVCGVALEEEEEPGPQPEAAPELAHTGIDATSGVNLAAFALVLVLAGALAAQRSARERSGLSIR